MFIVLFKNGEVVKVLSSQDKETISVGEKLLEGEYDQIKTVDNLEQLKEVLGVTKAEATSETVEAQSLNQLEEWWKSFSGQAEIFINTVAEKLEKAGKTDVKSLWEQAQSGGNSLLDELRELTKDKKDKK